jgi:hypothetical protein
MGRDTYEPIADLAEWANDSIRESIEIYERTRDSQPLSRCIGGTWQANDLRIHCCKRLAELRTELTYRYETGTFGSKVA